MCKKMSLSLAMVFILSLVVSVPVFANARLRVSYHECYGEYCAHSIFSFPEDLRIAIDGSGDVIFTPEHGAGEPIILNSIEDALYTLGNAQVGDVLSIPVVDANALSESENHEHGVDCEHDSEEFSLLNEVEVALNNNQTEYVLFTPANQSEPIQMLTDMEEVMAAMGDVQVGDIITIPVHDAEEIVTYISMDEFNAMFGHLRMITPFSCPGGWIRASQRVIGRDYRAIGTVNGVTTWQCYSHRVQVQFHCPCGRATMSSVEFHRGCGNTFRV